MQDIAISKPVQIFLLLSIGLITLPHFFHLPPALSLFFSIMLIWRVICVRKKNWLPGKIVVFLLLISGCLLLLSQYRGILGRDAGTGLFIIALGLKLLEIKKPRDIYLITFLAFIVAALEFLFVQNILMAGYILLVSCLLLGTLVSINSQESSTQISLKAAVLIVIQAIPIMIVIFIFFPRITAPRWMLFDSHSATTGLSDTLEPGSISKLGLSSELVFRVKFEGDIPPPNQRYWRGPVYSKTDGKRWTQTGNMHFGRFMDKPNYIGAPYKYTLMLEPQDKDWVYALDMPATFSSTLTRNPNYQLITSKNPDERAEYEITSHPEYNTGYITRAEYKDNLQLPDNPSPRIQKLVAQLQGFDGEPDTFISNLMRYFRTQNFYYTLFPPLMEENPVETFLFDARYGFCSHYATAFVYLMRVADIPARVVGGYQGGEYNKVGQFLEIRQANAHAWTEVWLQNRGWVRIDPTTAVAPQRIEQDVNIDMQIASGEVNFTPITIDSSSINWFKQARNLWNSADYSWQRWVINYNRANQEKFLSSFGIEGIKSMIYWLTAIIALLTAILALMLLRNKQNPTDKARLIYTKFCKKLAKEGIDRAVGEGARDFATRAKNANPQKADAIEKITALYIKTRYGKNPTGDDLKNLAELTSAFKI